MEPTALIAALQEHLASRFAIPVRTEVSNERPVPAIILDDMSIEDFTFHNTPLAQVVETDVGSDQRYYRFYYEMRVEYEVRHNSDPQAMKLLDDLRRELMLLRLDPQSLDGDVEHVELRGGGHLSRALIESSETELTQSAVFKSFHQVLKDNYDTIEQIQSSFTLE